jgi:hypothetical protein
MVAFTAMFGIAIQIYTGVITCGFAFGTNIYTESICAFLSIRADIVTGSAVFGVVGDIDTDIIAEDLAFFAYALAI